MKRLTLIFALIILANKAFSATRTAITGNWETNATWGGSAPACGDSLIIPAGVTVTITSVLDYVGCSTIKITLKGTLTFQNGKKLKLACGSKVYVFSGGVVDPGSGGGSSNLIDICSATVWIADNGPMTGPNCLPPGGCAGVSLPVELLSFTANLRNKKVDLSWTTASESNNDFFSVERSTNGHDFEAIGKVDGSGTINMLRDYSFQDAKPLSSIIYYRLKQTDYNGAFEYSRVIAVNASRLHRFAIFPNPASTQFNITFTEQMTEGDVQVQIWDSFGRKVYEEKIDFDGGSATINNARLRPGVYHLYIDAGNETLEETLVIK